jgi:hypothetical protein
MPDAYIETTILADLLLKPQSAKQKRAKEALKRFETTLLPVYSIKEWKAGPLDKFAYLHDKFVTTRSFAATLQAVAALPMFSYRRSTANEAMAAAAEVLKRQPTQFTVLGDDDKTRADSFRLALVNIILRSWNKRRKVASQVVDDLPCYLEAAPKIGKDGLFDLKPKLCEREQECCLASALKSRPDMLEALRKAVPETSTRREDQKRRQALKHLIKRPKDVVTREICSDLGDAIFAFFCPETAIVLTTNLRDHEPLAKALGKKAEKP